MKIKVLLIYHTFKKKIFDWFFDENDVRIMVESLNYIINTIRKYFMKKILLLTSSFLFCFSLANAEMNMGISGMYLDVEAVGKHTLKTTGVVENKTHNDEALAGEIFIEKELDGGLTLGVAVIPLSAEVGSSSVSRTDKLKSGDVTGTQRASADFSMHTTIYALIPLGSAGVYAKVGAGSVEVESTESLVTGAKYGDETVNFATIGLGFERDLDNGMFARFEGSYSDYESVELKSTGSDAVSTINGDIETITARLSIGRAF
mgnify:FL=1